ncbi:MAG: hypothetical protein J6P99_03695 [Paludibacteraceae bacterium]|nr:hypothetical protein [Paludibacteraceae bacterium]
MRVMLYEHSSVNHETYENVKSVVVNEDGSYQFVYSDSTMSQNVTIQGKWPDKIVVEKPE